MATKETVIKGLTICSAVFKDKITTDAFISVYCKHLEDIEEKWFSQAIDWCLTHNAFFPTIADIRKAALEISSRNYTEPKVIPKTGEWRPQQWIDAWDFHREKHYGELAEKAARRLGLSPRPLD